MAVQPGKDPEKESNTARNVGMGVMVPTTLAACVIVGCFLGNLIDGWLNSSPWGVVIGLIVGSLAGVREMMKLLKKMNR